jgi:hypothetical protein
MIAALFPMACLGVHPATAEPTGSIAASAGLLGVWAPDCAKPPSLENWYVTRASSAGGKLSTTTDNGAIIERTEAESIRVLSSTTVAMRIRAVEPRWLTSYGKVFDVVVEIDGDYSRTVRSVGPDGVVLTQDGISTVNKKPVPLLERCGRKPAGPKPAAPKPTA